MSVVALTVGGESREVRLAKGEASLDGRTVPFRELQRSGELVALEVGGEILPVRIARHGERVFVWCDGEVFEARRETGRQVTVANAATLTRPGRSAAAQVHPGLVAPMPGRLRKTLVREGEQVSKGQIVLVLEAMKMEHAIRAPHAGVVSRLDHAEGDLVEAGTVLAEISEEGTRDTGQE